MISVKSNLVRCTFHYVVARVAKGHVVLAILREVTRVVDLKGLGLFKLAVHVHFQIAILVEAQ